MRRLAIAIVLLLGQFVAPAWAQWTEDAQKCAETSDPNLAFDLCTRAIQSGALSGSGLAVTFNNRGNAYQSKGDYQRAIQDYDEAIRIDPEAALAFNNRGSAFQHMGNYDRAIQDYDQAIRLDGGFALSYNNRGRAHHLKEDYAQAIKDYGEAIDIDPDYPLAFYNRGLARFDQGVYIAAVPDFVRAVQLDPAKPYRVLALYLAKARGGAGEGGIGAELDLVEVGGAEAEREQPRIFRRAQQDGRQPDRVQGRPEAVARAGVVRADARGHGARGAAAEHDVEPGCEHVGQDCGRGRDNLRDHRPALVGGEPAGHLFVEGALKLTRA
jgi:tetratricopeptide (TPR) repeat protein